MSDVLSGARSLSPGEERALSQSLPRQEPGGVVSAPVSFAQQRLWFIEQLEDVGSAYHLFRYLRLRGVLDEAALARALNALVARHDALRTTFHDVGGTPEQRIAPAAGARCSLAVRDLGGHADAGAELRRAIAAEVATRFDLGRGPLFRCVLFRLAPDNHVLLFTVHHIVSDGWSLSVVARDFGALYAGYVRGEADPLPPLPVGYVDYMARQRRAQDPESIAAKLAYWREALAGVPALLDLPADHPRPARQRFGGASVPVRLEEELTARLKALGERHGTTLFRTLLAAWAVVAGRLSGQDDVVVGVPMAHRDREDAQGMIGFFVDTVVVRVDLSGTPTVAALLERVHQRAREARRHQDVPFEDVVRMVAPVRSLAYNPLFQTVLTWHNVAQARLALPGLRPAELEEPPVLDVALDTSLILHEEGGRIAGDLAYATSLFERATVERWADYFRRVLEAMAADAAVPVHDIPMLPADERARLLEAGNATAADYQAGVPVHRRFEAWADRAPGVPAVACEEAALTYGELEAAANRVAHALIARGVRRGDRVAVCMERSAALPVALLGALKAGAAYVPIDPAYPAERIAYMAADSGARVLLTRAAPAERTGGPGLPVLALDARGAVPEAAPADRPDVTVDAADLAYVIYTSGSTGRPKGVMVEHRALANLAGWHRAAFGVTAADRATLVAGVGFDASAWETWPYLACGASLHVAPEAARTDPAALRDWLAGRGITVTFLPTPLAESVLPLPWPAQAPLRVMLTGGDRLRSRPSASLPFTLVNNYGPTENTVVATSGAVAAGGEGLPTIGGPVGNTTAYVLDGRGAPVPTGVAGELFTGGAQVARGYLGRPALTAERFVPDPFAAAPGARMYATGDRVRWTEVRECVGAEVREWNGDENPREATTHALTHSRTHALEFLGRTDLQVKVRGFRIEPGEVEAALRAHPAVADAVCAARAEEGGAPRLLAWVAGDPADAALPAALREHVAERLPEYMVPAAIGVVAALPLTPNGKVDVAALATPGAARAAAGHVEPRTETERILAAAVAQLVGAERVSVTADFFDLGGDSILAMQLVSRAHGAGLELTTRQVFQHPTVAGLATVATAADASAAIPRLQPARDEAALLASVDDLSPDEVDSLLASLAAEA